MSQQVTQQHPAVVLRSHFVQLRALFAAALIAIVGLTGAVVVLATDDEEPVRTVQTIAAPAPASTDTVAPPGLRYDGGPDEGSRGPQAANLEPGTRYDGGPDEGSRGPGH
jgi:hypothetical protein